MKESNQLEDFISKYYVKMLNLATKIVTSREVAEDIVQDIIIELYSKNRYTNIKSLDNYLYTIVKNRCLNYLKSYSREQARYQSITNTVDWNHAERILIEEETNFMLHKAIDSLPEKTADIIKLALDGLSNIEIAKTIGVSINTVKTLKYGGIKKIIRFLSENK